MLSKVREQLLLLISDCEKTQTLHHQDLHEIITKCEYINASMHYLKLSYIINDLESIYMNSNTIDFLDVECIISKIKSHISL